MKVALVGNMNNNFFAMLRYLRDFNLECILYTDTDDIAHFIPESDTYDSESYINFIKKFPYTRTYHLINISFSRRKIRKEFLQYDVIVACGMTVAFLKKAGIQPDILVPYGWDFYGLTKPRRLFSSLSPVENIKIFFYNRVSKYQAQAFIDSAFILSNATKNLRIARMEKKLNVKIRDIGIPMLYLEDERPKNSPEWSFLAQRDFVVISHTRHIWYTDVGLPDHHLYGGDKANDKLIRAFSRFVETTSFKSPLLVLFEYGLDVVYSKKLILDLKLEQYVKWMPLLPRKNILQGLKHANFVVDQVRENICGVGGVTYEGLACGVPVITHTNGEINNSQNIIYKSPIIDVLTEDEILQVFRDFELNPKKYKEIGSQSAIWFNENLGRSLAKKYIKIFKYIHKKKSHTS